MTKNQELALALRVQTFLDLWKLSDKDSEGQANGITWRLHNDLLKAPGPKNQAFWDAFVSLCEIIAHGGFLAKNVVDAVIGDDTCPGKLRNRMSELCQVSWKARKRLEREARNVGNGQDHSPEALCVAPPGDGVTEQDASPA